jgi:MFS superfamily sulfate permease-like transporter
MSCQLGAHGIAPQIGSVLLLLVFYLTDFQLVEYIPKPAFSSMLVLSCIDMIYTWFYKSYFKTNDKFEWMVVPAIVLCAFVFDLLTAVFLGIAFSTFIFVGSSNRSGEFNTQMHFRPFLRWLFLQVSQHSAFTGVVKYVANGAVIRSTIERPFRKGDWLSDNGDFIQIIVLQNYLFFGNASTVYNYIASMFLRSVDSDNADSFACRKPKYLILVSETRNH